MPWQLVFRPDGVRLLLYPGEYTIGRKDCGIILQSDKSISRLHATLTVSATPPDSVRDLRVQPALQVVDSSRFGTLVNGQPAVEGVSTLIPDGGTLTLGTQGAAAEAVFVPLCVCVAALTSGADREAAATQAAALGGVVCDSWPAEPPAGGTLLLLVAGNAGAVPSVATAATAAALLTGTPVVHAAWLAAAAASPSPFGADDPLSHVAKFSAALAASPGGPPLVPNAYPKLRGKLLRSVRLLYGDTRGPLAQWDADAVAAVRLAGAEPLAAWDGAGSPPLLVAANDGAAPGAMALWPNCRATTVCRLLNCILGGALTDLEVPVSAAPPLPKEADSDTDGEADVVMATVVPTATVRPSGYAPFGSRRVATAATPAPTPAAAAAAAAAAAMPPPPPPPLGKGKKKVAPPNAAVQAKRLAEARAAEAAEAADAAERAARGFCGATVLMEVPPPRAPAVAAALVSDGLPNFKRFRKQAYVAVPYAGVVRYEAEPDPFQAVDEHAASRAAAARTAALGGALFASRVAAKKAPAKPRAAAKKAAPKKKGKLASSDEEEAIMLGDSD